MRSFSHLLKQDDVILTRDKLKIDSVGQFRRLLGYSLDLGRFEFEIERARKTIAERADLKKRQP